MQKNRKEINEKKSHYSSLEMDSKNHIEHSSSKLSTFYLSI